MKLFVLVKKCTWCNRLIALSYQKLPPNHPPYVLRACASIFHPHKDCFLNIYRKKSTSQNCWREIDALIFVYACPRSIRYLSRLAIPRILATYYESDESQISSTSNYHQAERLFCLKFCPLRRQNTGDYLKACSIIRLEDICDSLRFRINSCCGFKRIIMSDNDCVGPWQRWAS